MKHSALRTALLAGCLLVSPAARAELTIPVVVRVTELIQLDAGLDPGGFGVGQSLADLYALVTIDGMSLNNIADRCDNPPPQGLLTPYTFFNQEGSIVDSSCRNVPWTFTADVPLSSFQADPDGITIQIFIYDEDSGIGGGDDLAAKVGLGVPLGGRWTGTVEWPENCVRDGRAAFCWQIEAGQDLDGDGLLDEWEQFGLDADGDGTIDLDLPAMGADPLHKDLFVEIDWRPGFEPGLNEVQRWKAAFAAAPVDAGGIANPDGLPGINLHVDTGALTQGGVLVGDDLGGGNALATTFPVCTFDGAPGAFYPAKLANFDAARRSLVFRYGITSTQCCKSGPDLGRPCFIDSQCSGSACQSAGGQGELGGNDFVVWNTFFQESTLMHELGHNLKLHHGGDVADNCKPSYLSIMNYDHFVIQRLDGSSVIDFSPARQPDGTRGTAPLEPLAEDDLDETRIVDPADPHHLFAYTDASGTKRYAPIGAAVDWNGDGTATGSGLSVNIDDADAGSGRPADCTNSVLRSAADPLTGYDDWRNVSLPFLQFKDTADGPANPVDTPEPNDAELLAHRLMLNTADLSITKSGPAGPFEAGAEVELAYTLELANEGPNPAVVVEVGDVLPPGAVVLGHDPACVADPPGNLTCDLPALLAGASASVQLSIRAPARCSGGLPTPIVNRATIANAAEFAGLDPDPLDDEAVFESAVVDTTPPTLSLSVSSPTLWPPDHKLIPVSVSVVSADACDDTPTIRLVSIESNEPTSAPGSGNTGPDVQEATLGTDDREFLLRAERSGMGVGRIYTITYTAEDASGNVGQGVTTFVVPHNAAALAPR